MTNGTLDIVPTMIAIQRSRINKIVEELLIDYNVALKIWVQTQLTEYANEIADIQLTGSNLEPHFLQVPLLKLRALMLGLPSAGNDIIQQVQQKFVGRIGQDFVGMPNSPLPSSCVCCFQPLL